ncbi:monovalent cation:proton antiporter-2 (CPA2) family protein [Roseomonas sp. KE0001]|uniref:monovalent cation:proton antiporter-2 (CPA2) family protein n=1 Tax=Roseomonas sp. KE0001 TaxID=2479201 RepID=UPI0018DF2FFC|nr:monovalent cation:proton antiporter-2 (CPA2) family protein [Roseomonas sp. KE0001]MBI0433855.1 potassium transporter [Roseomonas sp. KE0001]
MAAEGYASELGPVVGILAAAVVAVPLFRRMGLGSVLGYLAAGLAIGPFGLRVVTDPQAILHVAELGVVMFLFVIGLEMQPSRLWGLRRQIFGLGVAQVAVCGALLTGIIWLAGFSPAVAFVAAMGFVLSSTAIAMQVLDEQGETATPAGQRIVSILLLEDLAIVPLLALVALLGPAQAEGDRWLHVAIALGSLAALLAAGRWLLNPMFALLAAAGAREVMTGAALLVVLGAALAMELGGLSMAMGAFLAGVLLSESVFRHQLETDIEPFRGLLLGLFFMGVGMSLDLGVLVRDWPLIVVGVLVLMLAKAAGVYLVGRAFGAGGREALRRAAVLAQGGEFAFVLYAAAQAGSVIDARTGALLTAVIILSMALTPPAVLLAARLPRRAEPSLEGIDKADALEGEVLMIGFGRFAQVASQGLLARGIDLSIIESSTEMIRTAASFGFKVYYGDGTRLDVLRTSGAGRARAILVCVDNRQAADHIVTLAREEFPQAKLFVRSYDRGHSLDLIRQGVDYEIRETFESAMAMGAAALAGLGVPEEEAADLMRDIRRRDAARLDLQLCGGLQAGRDLMHGNRPVPGPLTAPRRKGRALNPEAEVAMREE